MYRFLHDQVMRLANSGMTPREIGETIRLPASLATLWGCRSYYGAVYHDAVAQYNLRLGFFDGVPANLHQLPPVDSARRYVTFMGGADNVLRQAKASFDQGEYRWVAEVVNHVVFADADNVAAKQLLADAYEQLGYQSESAPWRNFYLTGALELRHGVNKPPVPNAASSDTIRAMPLPMFFDYLGVRLNGDRATGKSIEFTLELTDTHEKYVVGVENSAIHYSALSIPANPDASIVTTRAALNEVMMGAVTMEKQVVDGKATMGGDVRKLADFVGLLDTPDLWHPLTLSVAVATRQAIVAGILPAQPSVPDPLSMRLRLEAIAALRAVQGRFEQSLSRDVLMALPDFFILMIESRTWGFFHPTSTGFDPDCRPDPPRVTAEDVVERDRVIIVSETAVRQFLSGKLRFEDAAGHNLIMIDADREGRKALESMWETAYPKVGLSRFICT
jgi:hypothetical protein